MKTLTRITRKALLAVFILIISTSILSALEITTVSVTQPTTPGGNGSIGVQVSSVPSGKTIEYTVNDGKNWVASGISYFRGTAAFSVDLSPGTYNLAVREAGQTLFAIGYTSNPIVIADILTGTVTINHDGSPQYGDVLTANTSGITNNTGTLHYQWKRDGMTLSGSTSSTYTLAEIDIAGTMSIKVTSSVESGSLESDATPTVGKANSLMHHSWKRPSLTV